MDFNTIYIEYSHPFLDAITYFSQVMSIISGLGTLILLVITFRNHRETLDLAAKSAALNFAGKQADMFVEFNRQYANIWHMRSLPEVQINPVEFYTQFWSLQRQQFEAYRFNLVAEEAFLYWMETRKSEWEANADFGHMSWHEGFMAATKGWTPSKFEPFIKQVFQGVPAVEMSKVEKVNLFASVGL